MKTIDWLLISLIGADERLDVLMIAEGTKDKVCRKLCRLIRLSLLILTKENTNDFDCLGGRS